MKAWLREALLRLVLLLTAALVTVAGLIFLAVAAYLGLTQVLSPAVAALVVGLALLLVAACLGLALQLHTRDRSGLEPEAQVRQPSAPKAAAETALAGLLGGEAAGFLGSHSGKLSAAALAAGLAFGASPRVRRMAWRVALRGATMYVARKSVAVARD